MQALAADAPSQPLAPSLPQKTEAATVRDVDVLYAPRIEKASQAEVEFVPAPRVKPVKVKPAKAKRPKVAVSLQQC